MLQFISSCLNPGKIYCKMPQDSLKEFSPDISGNKMYIHSCCIAGNFPQPLLKMDNNNRIQTRSLNSTI